MPDHYVAVDLGASNVRVVLGCLDRGRLEMQVVCRFEHSPAWSGGKLRWRWQRIMAAVGEGLAAACRAAGPGSIRSVSCTGWAQDFGLLDREGRLAYSPVCYRDNRTEGVLDAIARRIPLDELVRRSGSTALPITTLCQLVAMVRDEPQVLRDAARLLNVADLVHHALCGRAATDFTLSTATQLRNLQQGCWDTELMGMFGIPEHIFPPICDVPGEIGRITGDLAPHTSLAGVPVVTTAGHDTAAATAVLVAPAEDALFLSIGTWAMVGCLVSAPSVPDAMDGRRVALLGLPFGRWGLFKSETGLWPLQECIRLWRRHDRTISAEQVVEEAQHAPIGSAVDLSAPRFQAPADMAAEIARACAESGQQLPIAPVEFARVILESLLQRLAAAACGLQGLAGHRFSRAHLVGGGSRNKYLCRRLPQVLGMPVYLGPAEATTAGNTLLQCVAAGDLRGPDDVAEAARRLMQEAGRPLEP